MVLCAAMVSPRFSFLLIIWFSASGCIARSIGRTCGKTKIPSYSSESLQHPRTLQETANILPMEEDSEYWLEIGRKFVQNQLQKLPSTRPAKNVIFFIGDGMGITTLAAARNLLGGEEEYLAFEKFPSTGMARTYSVDKIVSDSASTATAYLNGVKTKNEIIGLNAQAELNDCNPEFDESMLTHSIAKWFQDAGKSTGIVTTTRVTDASPAGTFSHISNRDWENDSEVKSKCLGENLPKDIAFQLIHGDVGEQFKVILGGGRQEFLDKSFRDEDGYNGKRSDGKNLIEDWRDLNETEKRVYVSNRKDLLEVETDKVDRLLGLFQNSHMLYHLEAEYMQVSNEKPTLAEMTKKAIEILQKDTEGYFLFVEGGRIDMGHHAVQAKIALDETIEMSKAVEVALNMTSDEDTLIVVSSDHSHTMSYAGYPKRHHGIYGFAATSDVDNLPFMTLSYANGNSFEKFLDTKTNTRSDPSELVSKNKYDQDFPSTLPLSSETHGGEDVAVFANGPYSHLFTGVYEQHTLPHLMAYAACVGSGRKACDD